MSAVAAVGTYSTGEFLRLQISTLGIDVRKAFATLRDAALTKYR